MTLIERGRPGRRRTQGFMRMSHTPHELHEEFPELADRIQELKVGNSHFAGLADAYDEVNRAVHRMETDIEPVDDTVLEAFKKKRLALKDDIAAFLQAR